tara:strand:- start:11577 stop:12629 length:1053 start_codon:yes stop_codon:yes gene_type:complete
MALSNLIIIFSFLLILKVADAKVEKKLQKLQSIETKQVLSNLRYISKDGKITLYQKSNGELSISKNYKIKVLLTGKKYTNYQIIEGSEGFLLISMDEKYLSLINPSKNKQIYLLDLKNLKLKKIADGSSPKLHLADAWFSYYKAKQKKIIFSKLTMPPKEISITINTGLNPFFVPKREILDDQTIIFTDMNERGEVALLKSMQGKTSVIKKYPSLFMRLEICQNQKKVLIGEFNFSKENPSSKILYLKNKKIDEANPLYSSNESDLGKINCTFNEEKIYFLKSFPNENLIQSELVEFDFKTKSISQLTNEKFVHQYFPMGSRLFASINGQQLLVIGKKELNDDRLPSDDR